MYEYITAELPQVLLQFSQLDTEKVRCSREAPQSYTGLA